MVKRCFQITPSSCRRRQRRRFLDGAPASLQQRWIAISPSAISPLAAAARKALDHLYISRYPALIHVQYHRGPIAPDIVLLIAHLETAAHNAAYVGRQ